MEAFFSEYVRCFRALIYGIAHLLHSNSFHVTTCTWNLGIVISS
uniref:Uncharacterized protein n=1 Tax=Physcomitrium patens TaxID=3218 RepID=A0A2K1L9X3_PHYPA|nr:hypothetical protein PHYPA_001249 [Physcomitrium patens]